MGWLDDLVRFAEGQLDDRGREALHARGVTDEQISRFQLGYLDRRLPDLDYPATFLEWSFRGGKLDDVFVLPLTNTLGEIKGLQFRHVERERSGYMDFIAEKGEPVLFGLGQAIPSIWETRSVFLVEGAFDHFPIQRFIEPTVATLTARVVEPLVRVLRRLVDDVWIGYDMDDTGRNASARFAKTYSTEFKVHIVDYPRVKMIDGKLSKDPSDLWEAWGDAQFSSFLKSLRHDPQTEPFHAQGLRAR